MAKVTFVDAREMVGCRIGNPVMIGKNLLLPIHIPIDQLSDEDFDRLCIAGVRSEEIEEFSIEATFKVEVPDGE